MSKSKCPGAAARGREIRMRPWRLTAFYSSSVSAWGGESSSWSGSSLESFTSGGEVSPGKFGWSVEFDVYTFWAAGSMWLSATWLAGFEWEISDM